MKQQILTLFPWTWLPSLALLIFFAFFIGLLIRVNLKSQQSIFSTAATLPLDDGEKYE